MAQLGRRARKIDLDDIVRVGRALGMQQLSLNAVASRLGVSAAAPAIGRASRRAGARVSTASRSQFAA